jgi:hypothetical protein
MAEPVRDTSSATSTAASEARQAQGLFASWQREGVFRGDVDLETVIQFVNLVANGIALATSIGSRFDVDALLRLVHTGIDPPE